MEKIIICNLKSNLLYSDIKSYVNKIKNYKNILTVPSNIYLKDFINENIEVGIQDISQYENGPYTSFVSANQASSLGVKYVLLNHVEVKKLTKQTKEDLMNKLYLSKKYNLKIILCIENIFELNEILNSFDLKDTIVVLEPEYTIGSNPLSLEEIKENISKIKDMLNSNNKVLYGGSVDKLNISSILSIKEVDGVLLGHASLDMENIIKEVM